MPLASIEIINVCNSLARHRIDGPRMMQEMAGQLMALLFRKASFGQESIPFISLGEKILAKAMALVARGLKTGSGNLSLEPETRCNPSSFSMGRVGVLSLVGLFNEPIEYKVFIIGGWKFIMHFPSRFFFESLDIEINVGAILFDVKISSICLINFSTIVDDYRQIELSSTVVLIQLCNSGAGL